MNLDGVELWHSARLQPMTLWRYRPWRPGHVHALRRGPSAGRRAPAGDDVHIAAAAAWLGRAQDVGRDGGVVGRYRFDRGWTSSYPETTGYIVPTFIALGAQLDPSYVARAARSIEFLLGVQFANGAFPALEIAENRTTPSPFNTAQIIHGLLAWHRHTGDEVSLCAARRAGEWMLSMQDQDGAWRKWFYDDTPACYSAYMSCWLADLGAACGDDRLLASAARHVDWVLSHRHPATGWFDRTAFSLREQEQRIANLHAIAYTLAGLLHSAEILRREDALDAVMAASRNIAATVSRLGWLPGVLDWQWQARADSACLTGNAQMALVWMDLHRQTDDSAWLAPVETALDSVKAAQLLDSPNPDLRGAVPGSSPLWGSYMDGRVLSWAAKFLIDALYRKAAIQRGTIR
jgi:hypothetical protein